MASVEFLRQLLMPVHVTAGAALLVLGLLQLAIPRKGRFHRSAGRLYVAAMVVSFLSSLPVILITSNIFLGLVGIFSLYLAVTGYRFARLRIRPEPAAIDRFLAVAFLGCAAAMMALATWYALHQAWLATAVLGVFGLIFLRGTVSDMRRVFGRDNGRASPWIRGHVIRMVGSYIASVTAFLVNVEPFGAHILNWLLPTLLGSLLISRLVRKFSPRESS